MVRHYTLTLTTGAKRLSTVIGNTNASGATDEGVAQWQNIWIQASNAATGAIYVGGYGTLLTATGAYGFVAPPSTIAPLDLGPGRLDDWVALGTADEKLQITVKG